MKDDRLYLVHMQECISWIDQFVAGGETLFRDDRKTQDAVLRNLQTLAESAQRITSETKTNHTEVDWQGISGFRNVLVHDYLGINLDRVWEIITGDLPQLKAQVERMLDEMGFSTDN